MKIKYTRTRTKSRCIRNTDYATIYVKFGGTSFCTVFAKHGRNMKGKNLQFVFAAGRTAYGRSPGAGLAEHFGGALVIGSPDGAAKRHERAAGDLPQRAPHVEPVL